MNPVSGQTVEEDGVYSTEWGREELLKRGDKFPSDLMLGNTEWNLESLPTTEQQTVLEDESLPLRKKHVHVRRDSK
jgi:hypothetical protein